MRPIITNIDTAAYKITKYLNNLLTPLSKSDYNILNTEDLTKRHREETISAGYKMIFIDVKNLFTNVPLNKTIDFILKKVYDEKKIQTNIPKRVLKKYYAFAPNTYILISITISIYNVMELQSALR